MKQNREGTNGKHTDRTAQLLWSQNCKFVLSGGPGTHSMGHAVQKKVALHALLCSQDVVQRNEQGREQ